MKHLYRKWKIDEFYVWRRCIFSVALRETCHNLHCNTIKSWKRKSFTTHSPLCITLSGLRVSS